VLSFIQLKKSTTIDKHQSMYLEHGSTEHLPCSRYVPLQTMQPAAQAQQPAPDTSQGSYLLNHQAGQMRSLVALHQIFPVAGKSLARDFLNKWLYSNLYVQRPLMDFSFPSVANLLSRQTSFCFFFILG